MKISRTLLSQFPKIPKQLQPIETPEKSGPGVYVIAREGEPYCKIGMTGDVKSRLRALQTSSPSTLYLASFMPTLDLERAKAEESKIHQKMDSFRVSGEWFLNEGWALMAGEVSFSDTDRFILDSIGFPPDLLPQIWTRKYSFQQFSGVPFDMGRHAHWNLFPDSCGTGFWIGSERVAFALLSAEKEDALFWNRVRDDDNCADLEDAEDKNCPWGYTLLDDMSNIHQFSTKFIPDGLGGQIFVAWNGDGYFQVGSKN